MKILVAINDGVIPVTSGVRVRNYFLWPALARLGHDIRILGLDPKRDPANAKGPPGIQCQYFSTDRGNVASRTFNAIQFSFHQWPGSRALASAVDQIAHDWQPDVIHAEQLIMAAYLPVVRRQRFSTIGRRAPLQTLTLHNVETDLLERTGSSNVPMIQPISQRLHSMNLRSFERRAVEAVDIAFAYSDADAQRYHALYPTARWSFTANGANASQVQPLPEVAQPKVLLVGTLSYQPNVEGLLWLLDKVRPRLARDISLTVAGANASPLVRERLAQETVRFEDAPPEIMPLYAEHAVCCVPLFQGSGTRGRILEALALGRLVITTTKGAEGLNIPADHGVIIADDADSTVATIEKWSRPSPERIEQAARGRAFVLDHFDWSVVAKGLAAQWSQCR